MRTHTWSLRVAFLAICAVGAWCLPVLWPRDPFLALGNGAAAAAFAVAGLLLAREPGQRGNGVLCLVTGGAWVLALVGLRGGGPLPLIEWFGGPPMFVALAVLLLRYPDARLPGPAERSFVGAVAGYVAVDRTLGALASRPEQWGYPPSSWWPGRWPDGTLHTLVTTVLPVGGVALACAFLALVARRWARSRGLDRRLMRPVVQASAGFGLAAGAELLGRVVPGRPVGVTVLAVEALAVLAVPAAFLVAAIRRRLAHAATADVVVRLAASPDSAELREILAAALQDPPLEVHFRAPGRDGWLDHDGHPVPDAPGDGRVCHAVPVDDGGPPVRVVVDRGLDRYATLVDAVLAAAALGLAKGRLQAAAGAHLAQVHAARRHLEDVGVTERRHLERALHDGAQQRLVALKLQLAAARHTAGGDVERELIDRTRRELQGALDEIRELARGVPSSVVAHTGLAPALAAVAERFPLRVELDVAAERWASEIESAAYFLVCEALTNTAKHSAAAHARVLVRPTAAGLAVEVTDDGHGGARIKEGGGLAGLATRVETLGGSFALASTEAGTRITASLPCA